MLKRRALITGLGGLLAGCAGGAPATTAASTPPVPTPPLPEPAPIEAAGPPGFDTFLDGVRAEARRAGVSQPTLQRALAGLQPNARVLELDRYQPETVLSWEQYRDRIVSPTRIENGRRAAAESRPLLGAISDRYGVAPGVVVAIWGMETNYGTNTGGFGVVEALATLAWEGRRAEYFRKELIAALKILEHGDVAPARMKGSWAGAMGQPQFMPTNFDRLAVDFDGDGRRDIWDSRPDALASIANYLARSGWKPGEPWGFPVRPPAGFDPERADTETRRPAADWARAGFRRADGAPLPATGTELALAVPTRSSGEVFLAGPNLRAIRRYNPPINYALAVGLLADRVV
ncbi:MAG TPA: lytic murein transglycosylase [Crenalkalicoccus sp.]|jgi:membrane-bound lytic murein transglycosylase B|nr:lytic murein transglycosylase [Crenalkalicoccus sp.]